MNSPLESRYPNLVDLCIPINEPGDLSDATIILQKVKGVWIMPTKIHGHIIYKRSFVDSDWESVDAVAVPDKVVEKVKAILQEWQSSTL